MINPSIVDKPYVAQDKHYTHDNRKREVYSLVITKNKKQVISVSLTVPELAEIATAINDFLKERIS